jgi:hypothetical protein
MGLATLATDHALIEAIAAEMSQGINCAVNFWMARIEDALHDPTLTTLGRMNAVQEILRQYRHGSAEASGTCDGYVA